MLTAKKRQRPKKKRGCAMNTAEESPETLIAGCQGLVVSIAKQIQRKLPPHFELDDLVADGQMGLAQAARDFDPSRGAKFSTFAYYRIRGAIYDGVSKVSWTSRAEYQRMRYQQQATRVLEESAESSPNSEQERADWLGQTTAKLAIVYLGSQSGERTFEAIDEGVPNPAAQLANEEAQEKLRETIDTLDEPALTLIKAIYFEGLTIQDAGKRRGLSKSWASRLHSKALDQLARTLRRLGVQN